jgi:hypothetical protein
MFLEGSVNKLAITQKKRSPEHHVRLATLCHIKHYLAAPEQLVYPLTAKERVNAAGGF